jgi:hypothetical protein
MSLLSFLFWWWKLKVNSFVWNTHDKK